MRCFSFHDVETGILHSNTVVLSVPDPDAVALLNCPPGHKPIEGIFDPLSQRVDVEHPRRVDCEDDDENDVYRIEFDVIDYQPPAPSGDHIWDSKTRRWRISAAASDKASRSDAARARIALLEAAQHRHLRDRALGKPGALEALQAIDDEISSLEAHL